MAHQKLSLEDILDEYSNNNPAKHSDNDVKDILKNHGRINKINNTSSYRRSRPANDYKPSDIGKPDVSFINSIGIDKIRSPKNRSEISTYDGAVLRSQNNQDSQENQESNYTPKIRRMSDSTRAREIEQLKKNRKKKKKSNFTYKKESPEGEYIYTPFPENDKKKRKNIFSPHSVNSEKISPAPRSDITSINLSEEFIFNSESLDVYIEQNEKNTKNKKQDNDFNYYGNAINIGKSINELKNSILTRFTLLLACSITSIFITLIPLWEPSENPQGFTAIQAIIGMFALIVSAPVIMNGFKKFLHFRPDSDSSAAIASVSCLMASVFAFFTPEQLQSGKINIYVPVGILGLLFNSIGKFLIITRAERNFKVVSKNSEKYGITGVQDDITAETLTRGILGDFPILSSMRKTDFLTDFLKYTYSSDISDKFCRYSIPASFIISLIVSFFITFIRQNTFSLNALSMGMSLFSMLICISSCAGIALVSNIPLNNVSKRVIQNRGIILGYQSVDDFYDTNSLLVDAHMLFPESSVTLAGIKLFSDTKTDEALLEAASLTRHAGSIMQNLFDDVIIRKETPLYDVENFSYEDSLGLCGWINNKRVLFGNRELMTSHNIEGIPTKARENELTGDNKDAVYLSVSGNLSAMFVVEIKAERNIKHWVNILDKNNIHLIIKSVDSCITLKRLSQLFEIPEELMRIIPKKLHDDFDEQTKKSVRLSASMACSGKFSEFAQLIMATKVVHSCSVAGLIIQAVSALTGIGLGIFFIAGFGSMSAHILILYNLLCAGITALVVNIKKI